MANTKNINDRAERKAKKRSQRKALKGEFAKLDRDQRRRFRNGETVGLRKWIAEQAAE